MLEVYRKLNFYLNEICKYLRCGNAFLLQNIAGISRLNSSFAHMINGLDLKHETVENHLTYQDVYLLAREVIESIDEGYLASFDNLMQSGELDFNFDHSFAVSKCVSIYKSNHVQQLIDINRVFNYTDVVLLVHEFMHYTNGLQQSQSRNYLTEFISIYFELYTIEYLLNKGINPFEIDYLRRLINTKDDVNRLMSYDIILLAYEQFGNLDSSTISFLQKYILQISDKAFEEDCCDFLSDLDYIKKQYEDELTIHPENLGRYLSESFITYNYKYLLGTAAAFYAYKYVDYKRIVAFNNHIHDYDHKAIYDIFLSLGIDFNSPLFEHQLAQTIEEYSSRFKNDKRMIKCGV